ncbi:MAG: galactokinase, partial [Halobacteriaceae archaeon]
LEKSDYDTVGKWMFESHTSLKTQYDVSCTELDAIVDILNQSDGVVGGRMTGAGFGGSVVALVRSNRVDTVVKTLTNQYTETTGIEPEIYEFQSVDGMAHRSE